ncbi:MAG: FkbM family methyltransferase [Planctomycetaceae bacterium]|nr:FkbM family methyltransferase [Planctomycetaceae bacterium]
MTNRLRDLLRNFVHRGRLLWHALHAPVLARQSFSQCGEDLILLFALQSLGIFRPRYLDIGAHHPMRLSNSALFYQLGGRGVNVEPNPLLFREFIRRRSGDVNLNVGVGSSQGMLDFYIMDNPELSTFSRDIADSYVHHQGARIRDVVPVSVSPVNEILDRYGTAGGFDVLSLDVEGLDEEILRAIDYERFAPLAFCVETVDFASGEKRLAAIAEFLISRGYFIYADTYINTIFFHQSRFRKLRSLMTGTSTTGPV